jgi:hypothetical protein
MMFWYSQRDTASRTTAYRAFSVLGCPRAVLVRVGGRVQLSDGGMPRPPVELPRGFAAGPELVVPADCTRAVTDLFVLQRDELRVVQRSEPRGGRSVNYKALTAAVLAGYLDELHARLPPPSEVRVRLRANPRPNSNCGYLRRARCRANPNPDWPQP